MGKSRKRKRTQKETNTPPTPTVETDLIVAGRTNQEDSEAKCNPPTKTKHEKPISNALFEKSENDVVKKQKKKRKKKRKVESGPTAKCDSESLEGLHTAASEAKCKSY